MTMQEYTNRRDLGSARNLINLAWTINLQYCPGRRAYLTRKQAVKMMVVRRLVTAWISDEVITMEFISMWHTALDYRDIMEIGGWKKLKKTRDGWRIPVRWLSKHESSVE